MNQNESWVCQRCTLLNSAERIKCRVCGNNIPFYGENSSQLQFAGLGQAFQHISAQCVSLEATFNAPTGWLCPRCSFVEVVGAVNCRQCRFERAIEDSLFQWLCSRCSLKLAEIPMSGKCPCCKKKAKPKSSVEPCHLVTLPAIENSQQIAQLIENIASICSKYQHSFIDDSFPHSPRSIGPLNRLKCKDTNIVWLRPQDIVTKEGLKYRWSLFNDPNALDIEQGGVGDCWFVSCLAIIARRPDILEQILVTKEYNFFGVYQIRLCMDGLWQTFVVDDFFPCSQRTRSMIFATGRNNQLWPSLVEKTFAKYCGSYAKLCGGNANEGLGILTGAPCQNINLDASRGKQPAWDMVWAQIQTALEANFLIVASCGHSSGQCDVNEYRTAGLLEFHCYTLLDVDQVGEKRVVRLRNPWGHFVWTGEFGPTWIGWTPELRSQLLKEGHAEGTFWLPYEAFVKFFYEVDICRLHVNWYNVRYPLKIGLDPNICGAIRLTVIETTQLNLSVFQKNSRKTEVDYVDVMLAVHEENCSGVPGKPMAMSKRVSAHNIDLNDLILKPGVYVIYVISVVPYLRCNILFSSQPVLTEVIPATLANVRMSFRSQLRKFGQAITVPGGVQAFLLEGSALMIENHSKLCIKLQMDVNRSENMVSTRGALVTLDVIPPFHYQIVMVGSQLETQRNSGWQLTYKVQMTALPRLGDMYPPAPFTQHVPGFDNQRVFNLNAPFPL